MAEPIVIIGAGAAGLIASLAAAESGASVTLIERASHLAGNTSRSTGYIPAAGTRFQREAGIEDTPEAMAKDILRSNGHQSDEGLTRLLCEQSGPTIEWLADRHKIPFICATDFLYPGQTAFRMHGPPSGYGAGLAKSLLQAVLETGNVHVRFDTPARGLVVHDGTIQGVFTDDAEIAARSVVLATNGFGANPAMVRGYIGPHVEPAVYFGAPEITGDGIHWGMNLGAATAAMGSYQGHPAVCYPNGPLMTWGIVVNGAFMVNRSGERFGNENVEVSAFAQQVYRQPGGEAWVILDQRIVQASMATRFMDVMDSGKMVRAQTVHDLAALLELPADSLANTVGSVNRVIAGRDTDHFGRTVFASRPMQMPFYGIHVRGGILHTQGGLVIDHLARVLRPDNSPIIGLYAAGGTAVGVSGTSGTGYSSGNGLLSAAVLGRIAGQSATGT